MLKRIKFKRRKHIFNGWKVYKVTDQKTCPGSYIQNVVTIETIEHDYHMYAYASDPSGLGTIESSEPMRLLMNKVREKLEWKDWTKEQAKWALVNSIIHELTHLMIEVRVFGIAIAGKEHKPTNPRCVYERQFAPHFLGPIRNPFKIKKPSEQTKEQTIYLPWHDLNEIDGILKFMGYKQ